MEIPEFVVSDGVEGVSNIDDEGFTVDLSRLLAAAGLAASRGEAQRLLRQNAVEVDGARASGDSTRVAGAPSSARAVGATSASCAARRALMPAPCGLLTRRGRIEVLGQRRPPTVIPVDVR